jgi:hypothetical protein
VHKIAREHQRAAVDQLLRRTPDVAAAAQRLTLHRQLNGLGRRRRATDIVRRMQQDIQNLTAGP